MYKISHTFCSFLPKKLDNFLPWFIYYFYIFWKFGISLSWCKKNYQKICFNNENIAISKHHFSWFQPVSNYTNEIGISTNALKPDRPADSLEGLNLLPFSRAFSRYCEFDALFYKVCDFDTLNAIHKSTAKIPTRKQY